jgi:hypothetical protein
MSFKHVSLDCIGTIYVFTLTQYISVSKDHEVQKSVLDVGHRSTFLLTNEMISIFHLYVATLQQHLNMEYTSLS